MIIRRSAAVVVALATATSAAGATSALYVTYQSAARAVEARAQDGRPGESAKNVILFVGDGMGISTVTATRILDGQRKGGSGEDNLLSYEHFPYSAFSRTYTTDLQVAESAGTMSAMMTGLKTYGGAISIAPNARAETCADPKHVVPTLLEQAEAAGLATGVVSTARITHATPAATYAHSVDRDWEVDATMPATAREAGCRDIARQLAEFDVGDGIEVILGGGRGMFMSATAPIRRTQERRAIGWTDVISLRSGARRTPAVSTSGARRNSTP